MVEYIEENPEKFMEDRKNMKIVKFPWTILLRQVLLFIAISLWTSYFLKGVIIGTPTVVIPQLRLELNSTTKFNEDLAPWISSVFGIGAIPWVFILPLLLELIGRKCTFMVICFVTFVGFIVFYCSDTALQILISELVTGILITASQSATPVILSEYTSPRYRGIFSTLKSASYLWGIWMANALGTYCHWKSIGILAFGCCSYMVTVAMWPESPFWLATKGRFEECATSHRWLKGTDSDAEKELLKLIDSQKHTKTNKKSFERFKEMIQLPEFYKPVAICFLLLTQYYTCGKLVCTMYAIEIIKKITDSESAAYKTMLMLDGVSVFSAYISSILSRYLKRRTLLISTTSVGNLFLLILSIYLYLVKWSILVENDKISISLLTVYSVAICSGVVILVSSIIGEILPLKYKSWSILLVAFSVNILHFSTLRIAPEIIRLCSINGAFLFYGLSSSATLLLLYKYLPETKEKTLQEIEDGFKGSSNSSAEIRTFL